MENNYALCRSVAIRNDMSHTHLTFWVYTCNNDNKVFIPKKQQTIMLLIHNNKQHDDFL